MAQHNIVFNFHILNGLATRHDAPGQGPPRTIEDDDLQPSQGERNWYLMMKDESRPVGPDEIYETVCWGSSIIRGEQIAGDKSVRHLVIFNRGPPRTIGLAM